VRCDSCSYTCRITCSNLKARSAAAAESARTTTNYSTFSAVAFFRVTVQLQTLGLSSQPNRRERQKNHALNSRSTFYCDNVFPILSGTSAFGVVLVACATALRTLSQFRNFLSPHSPTSYNTNLRRSQMIYLFIVCF